MMHLFRPIPGLKMRHRCGCIGIDSIRRDDVGELSSCFKALV